MRTFLNGGVQTYAGQGHKPSSAITLARIAAALNTTIDALIYE